MDADDYMARGIRTYRYYEKGDLVTDEAYLLRACLAVLIGIAQMQWGVPIEVETTDGKAG